MARWTAPVPLACYGLAPGDPGVYEIGFYRSGRFTPLYSGKGEGRIGIRGRLSKHYNGSHNEFIAEYLEWAQRDNLYCRWQVVHAAAKREARLQNRKRYPWNKRIETPW